MWAEGMFWCILDQDPLILMLDYNIAQSMQHDLFGALSTVVPSVLYLIQAIHTYFFSYLCIYIYTCVYRETEAEILTFYEGRNNFPNV